MLRQANKSRLPHPLGNPLQTLGGLFYVIYTLYIYTNVCHVCTIDRLVPAGVITLRQCNLILSMEARNNF